MTTISSLTTKQDSRPMPNWPMKSPGRSQNSAPLGAFADGGEEAVDLLLGQADAVVGEDEGRRFAARGVDFDRDLAR